MNATTLTDNTLAELRRVFPEETWRVIDYAFWGCVGGTLTLVFTTNKWWHGRVHVRRPHSPHREVRSVMLPHLGQVLDGMRRIYDEEYPPTDPEWGIEDF